MSSVRNMLHSLHGLSLKRFGAMAYKELRQMRRDRPTFGIMIGVPIIQLTLFGFAINSDPKHLPTAVLAADNSVFSRSVIYAMKNSEYFALTNTVSSEVEAQSLLRAGKVQFVLTIPTDFGRNLVRGERPALLVEADATDPAASGPAIQALQTLLPQVLRRDLQGALSSVGGSESPVELRLHRYYNEEGITQYNVVPGLMGVILTMTLVMITSLAMTRERERGTMENLLATPVQPLEVMLGKIVPYIGVGYVQMSIVILAAYSVFHVPIAGNLLLLYLATLPFMAATLAVGITFSTIAKTQLQAVQMSFFFFLPSILLSGFMFPFRGMPGWAQTLGSFLPLTHFLRIVRGVMLKGYTTFEVLPHVWPLLIFLFLVTVLSLARYRNTLD